MQSNNNHEDEEFPTSVMLINEISKLFDDKMRRESEKIGMRSGYRKLLFHIEMEDGHTQLELSELSHLRAPTVSIALQNMENEGIITRYADQKDQRLSRVYITDKGRNLHNNIIKKIKQTESCMMKGIRCEDEYVLRNLLLKIRENILAEEDK